MKNLSLHSSGKRDYLNMLKENYDRLSLEIQSNPKLSPSEKELALKTLNEKYKRERNNSDYNLFTSK